MPIPCPVCGTALLKEEDRDDRFFIDCPTCGPYSLSGSAMRMLEWQLRLRPDARALVGHVLYKMAAKEQWAMMSSDVLTAVVRDSSLPGPQEQLDNLVIWLGENQKNKGEGIRYSRRIQAATGGLDFSEMCFIVQCASERGLIRPVTFQQFSDGTRDWDTPLQLSFDGWRYLEELRKGKASSRLAFMAMQFGDEQLDAVYREHFKLAVASTGFELKRLDEGQPAGLIDDRLRVEIRQSRFLIADLSHHNKGAYWEAGYAEGLGKPVIYTCRKDAFNTEGTHFDTNHHLTVMWDPEYVGEAVEKLKATIRATLPEDAKMSD